MHILGFTRYNKVNYIITYTNVLTCNKQGATGSRTVWFQPTIFFPVLIAEFYAESWSLYGDFYVLHS